MAQKKINSKLERTTHSKMCKRLWIENINPKMFFFLKIGEYNFFYILKFEIFSVQTSKPDLKPDQVVLNRISDNGFYCYQQVVY